MTASTLKITTQLQREAIAKLSELVAHRAEAAEEIQTRHRENEARSKQEYERQREETRRNFETQKTKTAAEYKQATERAFFKYVTDGSAVVQEEEKFQETESQKQTEFLEDAKMLWEHKTRLAHESFRDQDVVVRNELVQFHDSLKQREAEITALLDEAKKLVERRCEWPADPPDRLVSPPGLAKQQYLDRFATAMVHAQEKLALVRKQPAARFLEDGWPILIFVFSAVACIYPFGLLLHPYGIPAVAVACIVVPLLLAVGVRAAVRPASRRQTLAALPDFQRMLDLARNELNAAHRTAQNLAEQAQRRLVQRRDQDVGSAQAAYDHAYQARVADQAGRVARATEDFADRKASIESLYDRQTRELESRYPPLLKKLERDFAAQMENLDSTYRGESTTERRRFEQDTIDLAKAWEEGVASFRESIGEMNRYRETHFPAWNRVTTKAKESFDDLTSLPFGHYEFQPPPVSFDSGREQERLEPFILPAVLSYPECPSLLVEAEGAGRDKGVELLRNVMLRLLTSLPPGKVRFTIIDPVGLGRNFSAFMHLADFDERLVSNRIWTEANHINQRLVDLTEHMEKVIQKYLRNEFASIQEYNAHAGEVAEPYHILVIANLPANFSEEAARRLVSIADSGARCGVYTLITADIRLKPPRNFERSDLETHSAVLVWDSERERFFWKHDLAREFPITLDAPPDEDRFTELVRAVGQAAKESSRVEVPFSSVIPAENAWWTGDSRHEIEVPLGRAGAKKLQYLRLGKGTSQHVLISGKTGSGKSNLLNAMITNLALHYSPQELQFYLIDFKKGVEFKAYAAMKLPHARVIAIESEREFGMSVLERLDGELKRRGDLFRKQGVQNLSGYRDALPNETMPRILLIIDEFQEFFTSDDKISHDSALLLDRLVRQGRAFGIHVLLGSQTLAGAYSLARSTIGQMAVRIALQCSESDAHLILSEDNTAARLLSRPGEAIYNDANGLLEGNHPFQTVWLSDSQREEYLRRLSETTQRRGLVVEAPTVFEGNVAADPAENSRLLEILSGTSTATNAVAPLVWLGAAVAIKDPTHAVFRRQAGANLLLIGQQEEQALGIMYNAVVALSAQMDATSDASTELRGCYLLDGSRSDAPEGGFERLFVGNMQRHVHRATLRNSSALVKRIAEEVERRMTTGEQDDAAIFLVVHNLARFRDLKKNDDFGISSFSDDDASADVGKEFAKILREGPSLGVHTLVWCDSYGNWSRWTERQTLRDFDLRVLFQMSAADSSNLMDSPIASRLGNHMALFYSEEQGQSEKFRPYGAPSREWIAQVERTIAASVSASAQT